MLPICYEPDATQLTPFPQWTIKFVAERHQTMPFSVLKLNEAMECVIPLLIFVYDILFIVFRGSFYLIRRVFSVV